ncbi:glycerophosphodiester phosphodiesterase [Cytobacillus sp. Sa5YUA1]|uniref:Glycerophosphodiester phosphodiesterase n=1 Tax=Cytobacillus stercorigallinarum TaxID=2762240 RepID=A0ABR8QRF8_9BACI|nr:glycerophosphodiester phosphodiesterase family protein [Cytobacillus stercorigallinarum]MBD7938134.1 glycerophosphodiester phosphodiesterase [Cytobacillus stercorigallinarum]
MRQVKRAYHTINAKLALMFKKQNQFFHPSFQKIAHRGAAGICPENTMIAFERALQLGADMIELDIQLTKDQQIVVIHDATIDRTTNGTGKVSDYTYEELCQFDAGSWFSKTFQGEKIPLLKDVLDKFYNQLGILIELKKPEKNPGIESLLNSLLMPYSTDSIIIQSFNLDSLRKIKKLMPSVKIAVLVNYPLQIKDIKRIAQEFEYVSLKWTMVNKKVMSALKQAQLRTIIWTINTKKQLDSVRCWDIDAIVTDHLQLLAKSKE